MDYPKFIVSTQKEEPISIQEVKLNRDQQDIPEPQTRINIWASPRDTY